MEKNKNMPTEKEVTFIADILGQEKLLYKKCKVYARITTDTQLAEKLNGLAEQVKNRFLAVYDLV